MKRPASFSLLSLLFISLAQGQASTADQGSGGLRSDVPILDVGVRLQKSVGFYTENGVTAQYTSQKLAR